MTGLGGGGGVTTPLQTLRFGLNIRYTLVETVHVSVSVISFTLSAMMFTIRIYIVEVMCYISFSFNKIFKEMSKKER